MINNSRTGSRQINHATGISSETLITAAVGALIISLACKCLKHSGTALFIGRWATPFLLLAICSRTAGMLRRQTDDGTDRKEELDITV